MIAVDTDVLTLVLLGEPTAMARLATVPPNQQAIPVVVAEEILRGRLDAIRKAQSSADGSRLIVAYQRFEETARILSRIQILRYTDHANALFLKWRSERIRIGSNDLRIAAICAAHSATLVTRNERDFRRIPGLKIDVWA